MKPTWFAGSILKVKATNGGGYIWKTGLLFWRFFAKVQAIVSLSS